MMTLLDEVVETAFRGWAPPTELTVSQFADAEIVVATGPLTGTRWSSDFAPYQRGIMDAFHEPGVQIVAVMGSSQWGKTATAVNFVCYHIAHDPCSILVVMPTVEPMAKDFAKNRLDPTIKASPMLSAVVDKRRAKDATNTTLSKTFRGGFIAMAGANSAASLASRPVRVLVCDEIDRYPPSLPGEGAPIAIAMKRTTTFRGRRRILLTSSPTKAGGPIHSWFQAGDQRRYFVPCPACHTMHPFEWRQVRWVENDPKTARLHCPACDYGIDEAERVAILQDGEWRAEAVDRPDTSVVSFHLWEAYSPLSSLREIVAGFLRARSFQKQGDQEEMRTWQNTTLGEAVEPDAGEGADPSPLFERRELYPSGIDVPNGACLLTMGVDVQDDRLELLVIGWGPGEESWLVDRQTLPGNTDGPDPWAALDEVLDRPYLHETGQHLTIDSTFIDSAGHRTANVYDYVARKGARKVYASIGRDGQRLLVSRPSIQSWGRTSRKVPLYTIGVDAAKALVVSRLKLTKFGPGFMHFPREDWADQELFEQLTSEVLMKKFTKGMPVMVWRKRRARNEGLDCAVLALAALKHQSRNLETTARDLTAKASGGRVVPVVATKREPFLKPMPDFWKGRR